MENEVGIVCGSRYFRDDDEYRRWFEIHSLGFTEWYVPRTPHWSLGNNRHTANCLAAIFPEFLHQLRTSSGEAIGYLSTVPGYWSGESEALQNFEYIDESLQFDTTKFALITFCYIFATELLRCPALFTGVARRMREMRLNGANTVFLIAIAIAPEYRKFGLPVLLIEAAKKAARKLGFRYVAAPFRPNAYGRYKLERRAGHSEELFVEYCALRNAEGLPIDPWLRTIVGLGARLIKPVLRSYTVRKPLAEFESFRESFRPGEWYSPGTDVWECGETCTWYVDRARKHAISVEPNYWGAFDVTSA
jgi:GNAT superfamily N-acetyltransferase